MELDIIKEIVAGVTKVDVRELTEESTFVMDLGADSIDIMRILMNIEERFSIILPKDSINKINKLSDLVDLIKSV